MIESFSYDSLFAFVATERLINKCESDTINKQKSQLGLCGSRGTGGVLTFGVSNSLEVFDLEEDEEGDDDSDLVIDDTD